MAGVSEPAPPPYGSTGREALDYALLEGIMDAVDAELRSVKADLSPNKRSMLVVTLYDICNGRREVDRDAVARLVRLAG
jgi:hypothetical protein